MEVLVVLIIAPAFSGGERHLLGFEQSKNGGGQTLMSIDLTGWFSDVLHPRLGASGKRSDSCMSDQRCTRTWRNSARPN